MISVTAPIATVSETNRREHWSQRHKRRKAQRQVAHQYLNLTITPPPEPPIVVTLTRISPRGLDCDNLRGALKGTRDGVADWLGIDDGDSRIEWRYGQERGKPKEKAVRIEIQEKRNV